MKRFFIILLFFGFCVGFLGIKNVQASSSDNGRGFLWTNNFGWISLNCYNDWDNNSNTLETSQCSGPGGNYGVKIDFDKDGEDVFLGTGSVYGYGWSPYLGPICFGKKCDDLIGDPPDGGSSDIVFDLADAEEVVGGMKMAWFHGAHDGEKGWARVLAHKYQGVNGGWIQFSGENEQYDVIRVGVGSGGDGLAEFRGVAWQRNDNGSGIGWIYFGGGSDTSLRQCKELEICTEIPIDDDCDKSYTGLPDGFSLDGPSTGRDCQDYECGVSYTGRHRGFYSSACWSRDRNHCAAQIPRGRYPFCGVLAEGFEYRENALSDGDCFDGLDNDLDARSFNAETGELENRRNTEDGTLPIDCNDPDCYNVVNPFNLTEICVRSEWGYCTDRVDNDSDGVTDCRDPDCANFPLCIPWCVCGEGDSATEVACRASEADLDSDGDGVLDEQYVAENGIRRTCDNCELVPNPYQDDINNNTIGDACDAFLETQQGSIYTSQIRIAKPPKSLTGQLADKYTATYCILTSAQFAPFNADSQLCSLTIPNPVSELRLRQYPDTIALLPNETQKTLLSYVDVKGLKGKRYGAVSLLGEELSVKQALESDNARVLYSAGNLSIDDEITILADRGPVTVLVEGDLSFGNNIQYANEIPAVLKQTASIAWVVIDPDPADGISAGNITISPLVTDLVGAMFAANTIETGEGLEKLTVKGLMVARRFNFQREYRPDYGAGVNPDDVRGAELIIYDGRVAINPPPGLADFVKVLPTFRSVAPR